MKRKIERPYGHRHNGGVVFLKSSLADALKKGDIVEFGGITVGTRQLRQLINLLPYEDCLVRANGRLEVETVERVFRKGADGHRRCSFRKPRHYHQWFAINNEAWVPRKAQTVVILRPRKF